MTNKDITKIYFEGDEIVALYQGSTLIFKKSGVVPPSPTGVYTVRGTLKPNSKAQNIELKVNGVNEQIDINEDKTFEHTFTNVPVTNMDNFTLSCKDELKTIDLSSFDTSQVTSMYGMFSDCTNLTSLDVSNFDTSNVTDMNTMFYWCQSLKSLDLSNFDTSKVTNMYRMFQYCTNLTSLDVSNFDTSKVTDMSYMFAYLNVITSLDVSNFDTSNVTNIGNMFYNCTKLTSLDVSNFNTSNVKSMEGMFSFCTALTSLDVSNFNTSKVTKMNNMFYNCTKLTSLDVSNFNTSNVTDMRYMFYKCKLTDLYINFDVSSIKKYNFYDIFNSCNSLENVVGKFEGAKYDLDLSYCPLTAQSAMVFINGLATVTEKRTLKLKASTYDSLTPEQIAIATAKGWTVTRS